MRMTYHEIRRKRVRTSDGRYIGRVNDVVAKKRGDKLRVTGLVVGSAGILRRIGFRHGSILRRAAPRAVPWRLVDAIDRDIVLSVDCASLDHLERGVKKLKGGRTA